MEIALSKFCDTDDVITPLIDEDENKRAGLGYQTAQNYHLSWRQLKTDDFLYLASQLKRPKFGKHCPARYVKARVPKSMWNSYYKFCFDRNPWDKAISLYYWQTRNILNRPSFGEYLNKLNPTKLSNARKYYDQDKLLVNDVFKFEELHTSLEFLSNKLSLPLSEGFPLTKNTIRNNQVHYSQLMNAKQALFIQRFCHKEIKLLRYQYE